jgi:hypothetical protein
MASFTIRIGAILIAAGVAAYVLTGATSVTALIPSAIGAGLALLGIVAVRRPDARQHAMHVAMVVALIGLAGSFTGLLALPDMLSGTGVRPSVALRAVMAVMLLVYLGVGLKSFADARLRRR